MLRPDFLNPTLIEYRDRRRIGADTQINGLMSGLTNADIGTLSHYLTQRE